VPPLIIGNEQAYNLWLMVQGQYRAGGMAQSTELDIAVIIQTMDLLEINDEFILNRVMKAGREVAKIQRERK